MRKEQSIIEIIVSDDDITQYEQISRYALTPDMIAPMASSQIPPAA